MSRQLYVCLHNFVDPLMHVQLRWCKLRTVILLHLPPPSSDEDITVVDTPMTFPTSSFKSWSTPTSIQIRNLGAAHTKTVAQVAYVLRFGPSTYVWKAKEISFPMDPALCKKISAVNGNRRNNMTLLALLSLTNYSESAQRSIVAFTREYTWDIESKEW